MIKSELIKRSPLRIFEKIIDGGVGKGNIAAIAAKKGVGKTAYLVHIATDILMQGGHVIHVSFAKKTDHIISWYEDIFTSIANEKKLENAIEIHDDIIRNRVIMNFNQKGIEISQILGSIEAMIVNGNFKASAVIIDGFEIEQMSIDGLKKIKDFAVKLSIEVWISASLQRDEPAFDENDFPYELEKLSNSFDLILTLKYDDQNIRMDIVQDHDNKSHVHMDGKLRLDPKTLLILDV